MSQIIKDCEEMLEKINKLKEPMLTEQEMLDLIDAMPQEHKGVSVETMEDGTGVVHMKEFLIHYGKALLAAVEQKNGNKKED